MEDPDAAEADMLTKTQCLALWSSRTPATVLSPPASCGYVYALESAYFVVQLRVARPATGDAIAKRSGRTTARGLAWMSSGGAARRR